MFDPGLQRLPPPVVREELERKQRELEAEAEHHRQVHAVRDERSKRSRLRAALLRALHAVSRRR